MNGPTQKLLDLYHDRLGSIPSPGGNGCHPDLLGVANLGIIAEVSPEQVIEDICGAIPHGKRVVTHREVVDAVNRAAEDHKVIMLPSGEPYHRYSQTQPRPVIDGPATLRKLVDQGRGVTEADIWEASPIPLKWPPEEDAIQVLAALYNDDNLVYIGENYADGVIGENIRKCSEWIDHLSHEGKPAPHIIPNPLNGKLAPKKSDPTKMSYRGDNNVIVYRFCTVEFDDISREDQLCFWASINLPISILIDSGGKSIHGWLDVRMLADVPTSEAWDHHIKSRLYARILEPMGVDSACKNPSRLSRFPGHFRTEKGKRQRILYLSPIGRKVF